MQVVLHADGNTRLKRTPYLDYLHNESDCLSQRKRRHANGKVETWKEILNDLNRERECKREKEREKQWQVRGQKTLASRQQLAKNRQKNEIQLMHCLTLIVLLSSF